MRGYICAGDVLVNGCPYRMFEATSPKPQAPWLIKRYGQKPIALKKQGRYWVGGGHKFTTFLGGPKGDIRRLCEA